LGRLRCVDTVGHIGPVAVLQFSAAATALTTALRPAVESGGPQVSAFLPGASEAGLTMAFEHGMRLKFPMLLMSSRDFGSWAQYLPRALCEATKLSSPSRFGQRVPVGWAFIGLLWSCLMKVTPTSPPFTHASSHRR
jgi:hypothetical protein